jgi:hypothetical protein
MESADALPGSMEERVQHHTAVLHRLGTAMDQVIATMERWERGGLPTPLSATPQPVPLPSPSLPEHSGIRLALPREYDGTVAGCHGPIPGDRSSVSFGGESVNSLVSCLSGKAL